MIENDKNYKKSYLQGTRKSNKQMKYEIEKCKGPDRPVSCYDEWSADKTFKKYKKNKEKIKEIDYDKYNDSDLIQEIIYSWTKHLEIIIEDISQNTRTILKKKAEKADMPLSALTSVYRKGLAAWLTGHRQGVAQHQWAMGRVNSFIRGGKVRKIDKTEWKKVQKHRSN